MRRASPCGKGKREPAIALLSGGSARASTRTFTLASLQFGYQTVLRPGDHDRPLRAETVRSATSSENILSRMYLLA